MNQNEIIAAYEEIDEINGTFKDSLQRFESQMTQELNELENLMADIKNNWTGSIRDQFASNFAKKQQKLEECLERIGQLKEAINQVKQRIAQALDVLRSSAQ